MPRYQPVPRPEPSQLNKLSTGSRPKRSYPSIPSPLLKPTAPIHPHPRHSPFDSLPIELQVEIFSHCLPPFPHFDVNEAPLLIARVCGAWRSLVLSTPKLWSSFEIEVTSSGTSISLRDFHILSTVKLWLARSKNYPLTVRVIHVPVARIVDPRSAQLLAVLIPEARRWRHVEFIIPAANVVPLRNLLPSEFPILQSLTLQMKGLWNSEPTWDLLAQSLPWNQLTSIDLQVENNHLPTLDQCIDILSQAENLKNCTMNLSCAINQERVRWESVSLLRLETLHLVLQSGNSSTPMQPNVNAAASLVEFLNLVSAPNLQTLRLVWLLPSSGQQTWSRFQPEFLSFLRRTSQTLRVFSLAYVPLSDVELIECLKVVPQVRELGLRFSLSDQEHDPVTDALFRACTHAASGPSSSLSSSEGRKRLSQSQHHTSEETPPLLQLDQVNIQCNGERYTNPALLAMIQSRWRRFGPSGSTASTSGVMSLTRFHLLSRKPVAAEVSKRVKAWSNEGLDVSIDSLVIRTQQEETNREAPFGYVDIDVKAYFRTVDVQIREWQDSQDEVAEEDVDPNEQKRLFFVAALNEMLGKEKQLATDPECSIILERMTYSMDDFVRRVFFDTLAGSYEQLARHRFASHVCQTLLTVARDTIARETRGIMPAVDESPDKGELRSLTHLVLDFCDVYPFASHVVRSLLLLLSPNLAALEGTQSAIRSKKSSAWKEKQGQMKSVFSDNKGKGKLVEAISKNCPPEFTRMARRLVEAVTAELDDNEIRAMATNQVACPGLKLLLEVEADQGMSSEPGSLMDRVTVGIVSSCRNGNSSNVEESDYLGTLLRDANSSHVLETIVSRCPDDVFNVLWRVYFKGKLPRLANHPVGNFVLAKAVERVSEEQLSEVFQELEGVWGKLIRTARTGVLRSVVDRTASFPALGRSLSGAVSSAFDVSASENKQLLAPCILTLLTLPDYRAAIASKTSDEPNLPPSSHHGKRHTQTASNILEPKVQGSILLQSLLRLPEPHNQLIIDSMLSLPVEERIKIAHNAAGSRIYDALLGSPTVPAKKKRQFIVDFIGNYHLLVDDKLGSRVGDRCWTFSDTYLKEKIARSLISKERDLAASFFGRFFTRNLNLFLLQKRPDEWRNIQSERKRASEPDLSEPRPTQSGASPAPLDEIPPRLDNDKKRKRKSRPEDEIDALFSTALGKKSKKAALADAPSTRAAITKPSESKHEPTDNNLEQVIGAIRSAPKSDFRPKKRR
ncbi:hypothetical protein NLJ89_g7571 [Agrocybe chaxingu]|uniref:Nucleolar protein 9 n=1 Tax=Agrocybe chaxingu TaxID=84603 RepID=A0A9W8MSZ8_9AGAR|nr:hypothetical protein NLJ89_g7571 [Agrocybe chaxingu]